MPVNTLVHYKWAQLSGMEVSNYNKAVLNEILFYVQILSFNVLSHVSAIKSILPFCP